MNTTRIPTATADGDGRLLATTTIGKYLIDRVLEVGARHDVAVYIELPRDLVTQPPLYQHTADTAAPQSEPRALAEAVEEAAVMLRRSRQPIIIAGIEVHRFGLQDLLLRLAETNQIPMAALLLSKSVIHENHPLYVGVYEAAMGRPAVTRCSVPPT